MKSFLTPVAIILVLIMLPMLADTGQTAEASKYYWMTTFSARLLAGSLSPGNHTFQYEFQYSYPEQGSLLGQVRQLEVSQQAPTMLGYVLLRPTGPQALVDGKNGLDCKQVKQIHPDQPAKFLVTWIADQKMTEVEVSQHIKSMQVTVRVDGGQPVAMTAENISISWDSLWNCRPWSYGTDLIEPAQQVYR